MMSNQGSQQHGRVLRQSQGNAQARVGIDEEVARLKSQFQGLALREANVPQDPFSRLPESLQLQILKLVLPIQTVQLPSWIEEAPNVGYAVDHPTVLEGGKFNIRVLEVSKLFYKLGRQIVYDAQLIIPYIPPPHENKRDPIERMRARLPRDHARYNNEQDLMVRAKYPRPLGVYPVSSSRPSCEQHEIMLKHGLRPAPNPYQIWSKRPNAATFKRSVRLDFNAVGPGAKEYGPIDCGPARPKQVHSICFASPRSVEIMFLSLVLFAKNLTLEGLRTALDAKKFPIDLVEISFPQRPDFHFGPDRIHCRHVRGEVERYAERCIQLIAWVIRNFECSTYVSEGKRYRHEFTVKRLAIYHMPRGRLGAQLLEALGSLGRNCQFHSLHDEWGHSIQYNRFDGYMYPYDVQPYTRNTPLGDVVGIVGLVRQSLVRVSNNINPFHIEDLPSELQRKILRFVLQDAENPFLGNFVKESTDRNNALKCRGTTAKCVTSVIDLLMVSKRFFFYGYDHFRTYQSKERWLYIGGRDIAWGNEPRPDRDLVTLTKRVCTWDVKGEREMVCRSNFVRNLRFDDGDLKTHYCRNSNRAALHKEKESMRRRLYMMLWWLNPASGIEIENVSLVISSLNAMLVALALSMYVTPVLDHRTGVESVVWKRGTSPWQWPLTGGTVQDVPTWTISAMGRRSWASGDAVSKVRSFTVTAVDYHWHAGDFEWLLRTLCVQRWGNGVRVEFEGWTREWTREDAVRTRALGPPVTITALEMLMKATFLDDWTDHHREYWRKRTERGSQRAWRKAVLGAE